ncbi:hypothetical protein [Methylocella silvestris]|uniref:OmpR/PhoB-type domain-containing protein n=1 Tax=Methylocella silvestris TaxID=199596 RepID=A0A2J7TJS2_METSI|nr:hypothetical protein [Methylocella silvestris]PNG27022.1 hypothetical protein CR492_04780 [Methylocella silvestris]
MTRPTFILGTFGHDQLVALSRRRPLGDVLLSTRLGVVSRYGGLVRPRPQGFTILAALACAGALTKDDLIEALWGEDPGGGPDNAGKVIDTVVFYLRQQIAPLGLRVSSHPTHVFTLDPLPLLAEAAE